MTVNVAVIGTGKIVEQFLDAAYQNRMKCVAIYSRKIETGKRIGDLFYVDHIYTDLDEMLLRDDIDFVYIASPNSLHYPQTMKCLQAGKSVIVEKPFSSTIEEAREMAALAKEKHLFLFEAIVSKYYPNVHKLKQEVSRIGKIRYVTCNFFQYSSKYQAFKGGDTPNVFNPAFSGGTLMDLNIYNIHFVVSMLGKPKNAIYYPVMERNIDVSGTVILEYDGFNANLTASKCCRGNNLCQIIGEDGYIEIPSGANLINDYTVHHGKETETVILGVEENRLFHECQAFAKMFEAKDYENCYELLNYSLSIMEIIDELRTKANLK